MCCRVIITKNLLFLYIYATGFNFLTIAYGLRNNFANKVFIKQNPLQISRKYIDFNINQ